MTGSFVHQHLADFILREFVVHEFSIGHDQPLGQFRHILVEESPGFRIHVQFHRRFQRFFDLTGCTLFFQRLENILADSQQLLHVGQDLLFIGLQLHFGEVCQVDGLFIELEDVVDFLCRVGQDRRPEADQHIGIGMQNSLHGPSF